MNKSQVLAIILGVYWAVALCSQNALSAQPCENEPTKQEVGKEAGQTKPLPGNEKAEERKKDKFADYPEHVRTNYHYILKNLQEANKDYVARGRKVTSTLDKSIKKYGLARLVGIRNDAHSSCLDLALKRIAHKMPENEFDKNTKHISQQYYSGIKKTNVSAPINFESKRIIQACQEKMRLDVLFYEKLLTSTPPANPKETNPVPDYEKLVRSAFSAKEYSDVTSKQLSAVNGIYDAFLKSRVGVRGAFATSGINKMRAFAIQYYKGEAEKIYSAKATRKALREMAGNRL